MPATVNDRQYVYRKTTTTSKSNDPKSSRGRSTSSSTAAGRDGKKKKNDSTSNSEEQQRRTLSGDDDDDNEQGEFIGAQHGLLDPSRKLGRRQYAKPYDSGGGIGGGSSQSQRIRRRRRRRNHTNWFRSLWLGIGLFLVLYTFWILDTLKDPIFGKLVDGNLDKHQPIAKLISVGMTLVLVVLLEYISNERRRYAILQKQHKQMMNNNNYAMSMSGRGVGGVGGVGDGGNKNKNEDPMMAMMLDGGGTWSKMGFKNGGLHYDQYHLSNSERSSLSHRLGISSSIGRTSSSSTDSTDYYNYNNTNNNNNAASITNDDGVPDSIFTSIGIPYCVVFGIIAYMLQFHRNVAKAHGSSSSADDDDDHEDVHHEGENNNDNIAMLYEGHEGSKRMKQMWYILGYFFYAAVESYGSLSVATFWSYVNSTLHLYDAEECYGTIIAIAQLGAIAGSTMITMHIWNSITLIVIACLIILLHIIIMTMFHKKYGGGNRRHHHHHRGGGGNYGGQYDDDDDDDDEETQDDDDDDDIDDDVTAMTKLEQEPTLWSGVYLILKHNYVLLILGVSCLYEVSLTCLNYQMTILGHARFEEGSTTTTTTSSSSLSSSSSSGNNTKTTTTTTTTVVDNMSFEQFMGHYGQMVNFCSLLLSWFIFPFLIKVIGLRITVRIFPTLLLLVNIIAYGIKPGNLFVLFISVSILKAMTYSVHDPAKEILYMPTSKAIKYKSKAWIDVVGARIAKAIGSSINTMAGNVTRSIHIASIPSLITAIALWIICYYVGIEFDNLVQTKTIVGSSRNNNTNNTDDDDDFIRNSVDFSTIVVFEGGGNDDKKNKNNETNNNNKGDGNDDDDDEIDDSHFRVVHDDDDDDEEDKK